MNTGLKNKVAIVTGAQHGIGAATAKALAAEGASVFIHYLRMPPAPGPMADSDYYREVALTADAVVEQIRAAGGRAACWEADFAVPENIPRMFDEAERCFGPVQVLVNNAADWQADSFLPPVADPANPLVRLYADRVSITAQTHDRHFAVNSRAVALAMAELIRRHIARGGRWGRIINVSTEGSHCFPGEISYGASKAALEAYSRSAALEFAQFGVTVNVVAPGATQTGWISPELEKEVIRNIPMGRLGQPEDLADVIVLLASDQARWVTGQMLNVGGGGRI